MFDSNRNHVKGFHLVVLTLTFAVGATFNLLFELQDRKSEVPIVEVFETISATPNQANTLIVTGVFDFGIKPKPPFRDIQWISINNATGIGYGCATSNDAPCNVDTTELPKWKMQQPHGIVVTNNRVYDWKSNVMGLEKLSFSTEEIKGISYRFSGRFLKSGVYEELKPSGIAVKGTLAKVVRGKVTYSEEINLRWNSWDAIDRETLTLNRKNN